MDFAYDARTNELRENLLNFVRTRIEPSEPVFAEQLAGLENKWAWNDAPVFKELQAQARERGLWNLFLPGAHGAGLTNVQYAPLAEITGWSGHLAPAALNCSPPDTGNMEVLSVFGSDVQKKQWLEPLLARRDPLRLRDDRARRRVLGRHEHRHPHRARWRRVRHQRAQVVHQRRMNPNARIFIVMGKTDPDGGAAPAAEHDPGSPRHPGRDVRPRHGGARLR